MSEFLFSIPDSWACMLPVMGSPYLPRQCSQGLGVWCVGKFLQFPLSWKMPLSSRAPSGTSELCP